MVAKMNRIENAARLAMADVGGEATAPAAQPGLALAVKLGLVVVCRGCPRGPLIFLRQCGRRPC